MDKKRFESEFSELVLGLHAVTITDKATGVQYLCCTGEMGTSLTPLLDTNGKPKVIFKGVNKNDSESQS